MSEYTGPTHACAGANCPSKEHRPELATRPARPECVQCAEYAAAPTRDDSDTTAFSDRDGWWHIHRLDAYPW